MGVICTIFKSVVYFTGGNKTFYINDNHILYYYIDVVRFTIEGSSYIINPNYLVNHGWIRAMLIFIQDLIYINSHLL